MHRVIRELGKVLPLVTMSESPELFYPGKRAVAIGSNVMFGRMFQFRNHGLKEPISMINKVLHEVIVKTMFG
jgi:hypothetical protein